MHVQYIYQKNEFVFAETNGHKPFPAKVTKVDLKTGIYTVSFIDYKCSSCVLASMMQKFTPENISRYEELYRNTTDPTEKTILRKIDIAKKEFHKIFTKKPRGKKGSTKTSDLGELGQEHFYPKEALQEQIGEKKVSSDHNAVNEKGNAIQEGDIIDKQKVVQMDDNQSSYFNICSKQASQKKQPQQQSRLKISLKSRKEKELQDTLNQLSPIRSNNDLSSEVAQGRHFTKPQAEVKLQQQVREDRRSQTVSPEIATPQTISSVASLHFDILQNWPKKHRNKKQKGRVQPPEVIKEEVSISRNSITNANHPLFRQNGEKIQYIYEESQTESEVRERAINVCEDVSIYDIDCSVDQLSLGQTNYSAMLHTMNYRKQRLSILQPADIVSHLVKIVDILLHQLSRQRSSRRARMLLMKKKQYLIVILSLNFIHLDHLLVENCIFKMIDFVCQYEASSPNVKSLYVVQSFSIRSKLNILYLHFKKQSNIQHVILSQSFQRYKDLKFTYY